MATRYPNKENLGMRNGGTYLAFAKFWWFGMNENFARLLKVLLNHE
jgi:hypothetical protein